MRIGIVTQQLRNNYGGLLQNWALQQILLKMDHEPITLNYENFFRLPPWYRRILSHIKTIATWMAPGRRRPWIRYEVFNRSRVSHKFICNHINVTPPFRKYRSGLVGKHCLEAVISGSDQVWRPQYNPGYVDKMFLSFVEDSGIKKIAYAASFGTSAWEFTAEEEKKCADSIRRLDNVSVREKSGVVLCREHFGIESTCVLDPTMLLDREYYDNLIEGSTTPDGPYMLAYILDNELYDKTKVERLGQSLGLPVKLVYADDEMLLEVEEWIAMFKNAAYVVTNSFHGTVFSIIYHRPFLSLVHEGRGSARFFDLLEQFNLSDRLIAELPEACDAISDIDWDAVDSRLADRRQLSIEWLKNSLVSTNTES